MTGSIYLFLCRLSTSGENEQMIFDQLEIVKNVTSSASGIQNDVKMRYLFESWTCFESICIPTKDINRQDRM